MKKRRKTPAASYRFDRFVFLAGALTLFREGLIVPLAPKPARFLWCLLEHAGEIVDRRTLWKEVWGRKDDVNYSQITDCLSDVRRALDLPDAIVTFSRSGADGYTFTREVTALSESEWPAGKESSERRGGSHGGARMSLGDGPEQITIDSRFYLDTGTVPVSHTIDRPTRDMIVRLTEEVRELCIALRGLTEFMGVMKELNTTLNTLVALIERLPLDKTAVNTLAVFTEVVGGLLEKARKFS